MWIVQEGHADCSDGAWAVVDDETDELAPDGCHDEQADAEAQAVELNEADEEADGDAAAQVPWVGLLATEQADRIGASDPRVFNEGTFAWELGGRSLPFPFKAQFKTAGMMDGGHAGAELVGRVEQVARVRLPSTAVDQLVGFHVDGDVAVVGRGFLDTSMEYGQQAIDAVKNGNMTGVSLDPGSDTLAVQRCLETEEDEWGEFCVDAELVFLTYDIAGLTLVDTPGMPQARIRLADDIDVAAEWATLEDMGVGTGIAEDDVVDEEGMAASSMLGDLPLPPLDYFVQPEPARLTPFTVGEPDADGWIPVSGHVAPREGSGVCHIGYPDCREAPDSPTNYAAGFNLGAFPTADGQVAVGRITMGTAHAPLKLGGRPVTALEAQHHYDHNGYVAAFVHGVNGEHGWWVSGVVRPSLTPEQVLDLSAGSLSGDWRDIGGALEGIGVTVVNRPGFPIEREAAIVADGRSVGMVACGVLTPCGDCGASAPVASSPLVDDRLANLERRLARQELLDSDRHFDALAAGILRHTPQDQALQALALRQRRARRNARRRP